MQKIRNILSALVKNEIANDKINSYIILIIVL